MQGEARGQSVLEWSCLADWFDTVCNLDWSEQLLGDVLEPDVTCDAAVFVNDYRRVGVGVAEEFEQRNDGLLLRYKVDSADEFVEGFMWLEQEVSQVDKSDDIVLVLDVFRRYRPCS